MAGGDKHQQAAGAGKGRYGGAGARVAALRAGGNKGPTIPSFVSSILPTMKTTGAASTSFFGGGISSAAAATKILASKASSQLFVPETATSKVGNAHHLHLPQQPTSSQRPTSSASAAASATQQSKFKATAQQYYSSAAADKTHMQSNKRPVSGNAKSNKTAGDAKKLRRD